MIYQPPSADDVAMEEYLMLSLERLEVEYSNCAILLAGDFNKTLLPMVNSAVKIFQLKPVVTSPTRGDRIVDQILQIAPSIFQLQLCYLLLVSRIIEQYLLMPNFDQSLPNRNIK